MYKKDIPRTSIACIVACMHGGMHGGRHTGDELKGRGQDLHLTHVQPQLVWLLKKVEVDANLERLLPKQSSVMHAGVLTPVYVTWSICWQRDVGSTADGLTWGCCPRGRA
jgi:hypothetical protein